MDLLPETFSCPPRNQLILPLERSQSFTWSNGLVHVNRSLAIDPQNVSEFFTDCSYNSVYEWPARVELKCGNNSLFFAPVLDTALLKCTVFFPGGRSTPLWSQTFLNDTVPLFTKDNKLERLLCAAIFRHLCGDRCPVCVLKFLQVV